MANTPTPGMMQAIYNLLNTALARDTGVDVPFPTKKEAEAFRFKVYSARSRAKKADAIFADAPARTVCHPFDTLTILVLPKGDRWVVRVEKVNESPFPIEDSVTGEAVELDTAQPDLSTLDYNDFFDEEGNPKA